MSACLTPLDEMCEGGKQIFHVLLMRQASRHVDFVADVEDVSATLLLPSSTLRGSIRLPRASYTSIDQWSGRRDSRGL